MDPITVVNCPVFFEDAAFKAIRALLEDRDYSTVFVLTDSNTAPHCLPIFLREMGTGFQFRELSMQAGEEYKNMDSCMDLWKTMSDAGGDRKSLLINLGGGVVTDLGGFVASVFKRGIDFIQVPTSLLAMVDAAIGGKTGIDLGPLKNQLGLINHPEMVVVHAQFLATLPERQIVNGMAEMWKHGIIRDKSYWEALKKAPQNSWPDLIHKSVRIKADIVNQDPTEKGLRKILNFGHTLGHAIESYFLDSTEKASLLHGEAIAAGMIMETYLSAEYAGLEKETAENVSRTLLQNYPRTQILRQDIDPILNLLKHDKKNEQGRINFVLLKSMGEAVFNCEVSRESLENALAYYMEL